MNLFVKLYKESRAFGNEYTDKNIDFAVTARTISKCGKLEDLQELTNFYEEETEEFPNLTSYERDMKLSGMKESDFE